MHNLFDAHIAVKHLDSYFAVLSEVGYVKKSIIKRYMMYMFLIDFVDSVYPYLSEEDYKTIYTFMNEIFSGSSCLIPYPVFCYRKMAVGKPTYMGAPSLRKTDLENKLRSIIDSKELRKV